MICITHSIVQQDVDRTHSDLQVYELVALCSEAVTGMALLPARVLPMYVMSLPCGISCNGLGNECSEIGGYLGCG